MKLSSSLVAMLVGLAAASPLANPSYAGRASIAKRYDKAQIDSEIKKLGDLIADMQKTKDEKVAEKSEGWQKTIDDLTKIKEAVTAAPPEKASDEINKLDGPLSRMRQSRDENYERRTTKLSGVEDIKRELLDAANSVPTKF